MISERYTVIRESGGSVFTAIEERVLSEQPCESPSTTCWCKCGSNPFGEGVTCGGDKRLCDPCRIRAKSEEAG